VNKRSKTSHSGSARNPGWFVKGRSGNRNGRPKTSRAEPPSAFEVLLEKTLTVADRGGTRTIPLEQALQQRTYQDALAGKRTAMRQVVQWIIKREAWLAKQHAPGAKSPMTLIEHHPKNADAALVLLGIAAPHPARAKMGGARAELLLEPWAVQAALRRRRGGQRLTDNECEEIRRCTRDADSLRWPRGTSE
jgi:hypothetical protein